LLVHADIGREEDLTLVPGESAGATGSDQAQGSTKILRQELAVGMDLRGVLVTAGIPAQLARELLKAMQFDPDFPRHPLPGSHLTLAYTSPAQKRDLTTAPNLLYAILDDGHKSHQIFRYAPSESMVAYVNRNGLGGALISLQEPIPNAHVSSGFGWRVHPILGVRKFHNGVDYAAPLGTPVLAAGDGVVEEVGWHGRNGRYVRIRHDAHLVTTYSHLKRYAAGLKKGMQVRAGQTIAFVGQSGLATGPHLYYEVIVDNRPVRPIGMPIVARVRLANSELASFHQQIGLSALTTLSGR
jgi:hypothetical protein